MQTKALTVHTTSNAVLAAKALADDLNGAFVERREEVKALLVALVAREHVLLLGDPGTGKSALTNALTGALGGGAFSVLMTRYTVPEEVFGPISLVGLEADEYRRVTTGYLPEARVAFLDEIFKANSAILNAMLTIVNERVYDNGGKRVPCPLEIVVGASNELPADDSLGALYDRFVLRRWVAPIANRDAFRGLLASSSEPKIRATLTDAHLAELRAAAEAVVLTEDVLDTLCEIRDTLARTHGINASDRRWRKIAKLVRAQAALEGRTETVPTDLMVIVDSLWNRPEERPAVLSTVSVLAAPGLAQALATLDAATELLAGLGDLSKASVQDTKDATGKSVRGLASANDAIKAMIAEVGALDQGGGVDGILASLRQLHVSVARATRARLGIS